MLAMNSRTLRGVRHPASSLTSIASMLAPTESGKADSPVHPDEQGFCV
jgi:hypothetical protein